MDLRSCTLFILLLIVFSVGDGSKEIFSKEGFSFFTGTDWNAVVGRESFGALPYIIGTLVSSGIAMVIGVPISLGIAIFLSEIGPVDALPLRIWRLASQPYESAHAQGWGAALVLILIVLILNIVLRLLSQ